MFLRRFGTLPGFRLPPSALGRRTAVIASPTQHLFLRKAESGKRSAESGERYSAIRSQP